MNRGASHLHNMIRRQEDSQGTRPEPLSTKYRSSVAFAQVLRYLHLPPIPVGRWPSIPSARAELPIMINRWPLQNQKLHFRKETRPIKKKSGYHGLCYRTALGRPWYSALTIRPPTRHPARRSILESPLKYTLIWGEVIVGISTMDTTSNGPKA